MGIPPGVPVKAAKSIGPCPSYCRADCPGKQRPEHPPVACPGVPAAWLPAAALRLIRKVLFIRSSSLFRTQQIFYRVRFYLKTPLFSTLTVKPCASGDWPHPETVSASHLVTKVEEGGLTGKPKSVKDVMLH